MNINKALKEKNKLVKSILERSKRITEENSVIVGAVRNYSPTVELDVMMEEINELVNLKASIHRANAEVYDKIFRLSELKNLAKTLRGVSTQEGNVNRGRYGDTTIMTYESEIKTSEKDSLIKNIETLIEELQEALDAHNATKTI
jgi:hypothetical protein